ncbi:MAG: GNAT family N-acetyltransferase [Thermomicrobiales bacterium]
MALTFEALDGSHIEAAAALLAARHRRDRATLPLLPPAFEAQSNAARLLEAVMRVNGAAGVAALRAGQLVGYLCGAPVLHPSAYLYSCFMQPRAADISDAGFALAEDAPPDLLRRLYGELAAPWVARGLTAQYVTAPAAAEWSEAWDDLEFGRFTALGAQRVAEVPEPTSMPARFSCRRADLADLPALEAATVAFFRSLAGPPAFLPFMEEAIPAQRQIIAELLADPACTVLLAVDAAGELAGYMALVEQSSPHWMLSPLSAPSSAVYLQIAYVAPQWRGAGVGAALAARSLEWAKERGAEHCLVEWITASRAAAFWRRQGFQVINYWRRRSVDPRAAWAGCMGDGGS